MHFAQQAVREWEAVADAGYAVLEGSDVIGDFDHVIERRAWSLGQLEQEEIGEGRLSALDLRGQHRFTPDVRVEKEVRVRQECADAVETSDGQCGPFQEHLTGPCDLQRRQGRQRQGDERTDLLTRRGRGLVGTGGFASHRAKLE